MTLFRINILVFFLLCFSSTIGQTNCDSLSSDITKQFDSYSKNKFTRLKKNKKLDPKIAFEIATYLRHKSDTTFRQWYLRYIDLIIFKTLDSPDTSSKTGLILFNIGQAYYYLDDYKAAAIWIKNAISLKCSDICVTYYYLQIKKRIDIQDE